MSDDTLTTPEPTPGAIDGLDDQAALTPGMVFGHIYAFLHNKVVGLVLILAAGLLSLFGVLFPQMPSSARADAESMASWIESVRPTFGGWTDILNAIGFFTMFSSIPFLVVMALLAASIVACTVHRLPVLWQAAKHPHTRVTAAFFDRARLRSTFTTSASPEAAFEILCADARKHRMRVVVDDRGPGLNAYMDRNYWAPFGTAFAHAAFVTIMAGFVVSALSGFRNEQFTLTIGFPREVGNGTNLVAEATAFQDSYYDNGSPKDYVADLRVSDNGEQVAQQQVRVNSPLSYHGVMFHQAYFGVAAVMKIDDSSGAEVFHNGVALEWATPDKTLTYGRTTLGDQTIYVIGSASGQTGTGIEPGQVRVEIYGTANNEPIGKAVLDVGTPTTVGDHTFTFEREQQFTGMIVKKDPGTPIVWSGFLLLVIGTCMTMFFRHHRMWVRVSGCDEGTLVRLGSPDRQDSGFTRFFTGMIMRTSGKMAHIEERTNNAS
ncbi:hypothetical protein HMPREF1531_01518 [Propionibacterium sp. oral taxon 192 str. F0372]|mgnify:CR=1 FL=1|uniref:cytochrome c biogenesis protein ResB n=1 Tax=Propionibacterium sp. oral taxon 192 TaxID=671222 RepID=UPI000352E0E9|nr:cytochrome c biogenesis protein ResB [Propionibacterium sp. oral taxon 192]EPH03457.1 hypothetical protein HMPREF1531_01518 [Propionibacterium sp. oral taxon 192 str. F0372]